MSLPAGVLLRTATVRDAAAGAALHRACWREAYGEYVDAAILAATTADLAAWTERWRHQVQNGPPRVVAETVLGDGNATGELVGFAVAGPARDPDALATLELYAIYTRRAWWGSGLGGALIQAVLPPGPQAPSCSLWVLEANARARAFYRRHGFEPDGGRLRDDSLEADEVRLLRTVGGGE